MASSGCTCSQEYRQAVVVPIAQPLRAILSEKLAQELQLPGFVLVSLISSNCCNDVRMAVMPFCPLVASNVQVRFWVSISSS